MQPKLICQILNAVILVASMWQVFSVDAAPAPSKVIIAHTGMNARTVVLWTAQEQKFFAKYGTDAQVIFIRQAPILLAGMSNGNVQIAATGGTSALLGASGGMDLKVSLHERQGH